MADELIMPNFLDSYNKGQQYGQQQQFNALAGQALSAPSDQQNALLSQAAQYDPMSALKIQGALSDQQQNQAQTQAILAKNKQDQIVATAKMLQTVPDPYKNQVYQKLIPSLQAMGITQLPPEYNDQVGQVVDSIADAYTPKSAAVQEFQQMTKGLTPDQVAQARMVGLGIAPKAQGVPDQIRTLQSLQSDPSLLHTEMELRAASRAPASGGGDKAANYQIVQGADGSMYRANKLTGEVEPLQAGGQNVIGSNSFKSSAQTDKQAKAEAAKEDTLATYDQGIDQIDSLLSSPGASGLGTFVGDIAGAIPHTDTSNAKAQLDVIKNQVLLNTISKLKSLSSTGASGFGSLSNQEGDTLRNSISSLSTAQSHGQIVDSLHKIRNVMQQSRNRIAGHPVDVSGASSTQSPTDGQQNQLNGWSIQKVDH